MSVNLGTAYLQLEPSTDGLVPGMRKAFGGVEREAEKSGRQSGEKFATGAGKGTGGVKGLIGKLGIIGLGIQAAATFSQEFSAGLEGAADLEQSKGAIAAIFKDDVDEIDEAARQASTALGLSRNAYNELASTVGAGLKNKGIQDYAGETQKLLGLGADLAAQFGGDTKTAVEAISSLMRGEADPIERYGVSINETAVAAELAATGQNKLEGSALEAAKAQARLDILMRQTIDSHGTFAAEADTVAGKQQRASAQWEDLRTKIGEGFLPVVGAVVGFLSDRLLPGIDGITNAWQRGEGPLGRVREAFDKVGAVLRDKALPMLQAVARYVEEKVAPVFTALGEDVIAPIFNGIILPLFDSFWDFLTNYVGPVVRWLWEGVFAPTFKSIGDVVSNFGEHWSRVWEGIKSAAAAPVNFVIDVVWNNGLRKIINAVTSLFGGDAIGPAKLVGTGGGKSNAYAKGQGPFGGMARGGILPGSSRWTDGDDQLVWMRRGEGVTVSEALDDYEKARLLSLNRAAMRGVSPEQFRHQFDGHAKGGIVGEVKNPRNLTQFRGHTFTNLFASLLGVAEKLSQTVFRISQGGFRPYTPWSGSSHQGDAVDILSPISTAVITALRSVGIAAWDRTGKGKWDPHIHGVPTPGAGYAGGSAVWQAQDYVRGGDGLGGRDNGPRVAVGGSIAGTSFGLLDIPGAIKDVVASMGELTGPWGGMLREAFTGMAERVQDWAMDKLGLGLQGSVSGGIGDKLPVRGYWQGTPSAAPGLAWVGERGPELVNFRGGERVYDARESAAMAGLGSLVIQELHVDMSQVQTVAELEAWLREISTRALVNGVTYG